MKRVLFPFLFSFFILCNMAFAENVEIVKPDVGKIMLNNHLFAVETEVNGLISSNDVYYMICIDIKNNGIISSKCSNWFNNKIKNSYTSSFFVTENGVYEIQARLIKKVGNKQTLIAKTEKTINIESVEKIKNETSELKNYIKTHESEWKKDRTISFWTFVNWIKKVGKEIYNAIYKFIFRDFVPRSEYEKKISELEMKINMLEKIIENIDEKALVKGCVKTMIKYNITEMDCGGKTLILHNNEITIIEPLR